MHNRQLWTQQVATRDTCPVANLKGTFFCMTEVTGACETIQPPQKDFAAKIWWPSTTHYPAWLVGVGNSHIKYTAVCHQRRGKENPLCKCIKSPCIISKLCDDLRMNPSGMWWISGALPSLQMMRNCSPSGDLPESWNFKSNWNPLECWFEGCVMLFNLERLFKRRHRLKPLSKSNFCRMVKIRESRWNCIPMLLLF